MGSSKKFDIACGPSPALRQRATERSAAFQSGRPLQHMFPVVLLGGSPQVFSLFLTARAGNGLHSHPREIHPIPSFGSTLHRHVNAPPCRAASCRTCEAQHAR